MKRVLILFLLLFLGVSGVNASLGLSPALVESNFRPGLDFSVTFKVLGPVPEQKIHVYSTGDLAEYVTFDREEFYGAQEFTAHISLPNIVDKPGKNRLYIGAEQILNGSTGLGARLAVQALIVVHVAYPGRYAEASLSATTVNQGEPVKLDLELHNLGNEDIVVSPEVIIESYNGDRVENFNLESRIVAKQTSANFERYLDTSRYNPGEYTAFAKIDYGNFINLSTTFRIGTLYVNITNYTQGFTSGKLNRFDIEVESLWNSKVENIYAEVNVTLNNKSVDFFKTSPITLDSWRTGVLTGYLNLENLGAGEYIGDITLVYVGKTTSKKVNISVVNGSNLYTILIIAGVIVLAIALLIAIILIRKHGKKKKKRK